ncbi:hypothetical protein [Clostridium cibarium]|uniref:Membrane-spanning protein n=1 Tax=Clostridium cibarium TaxID=2762247 RepID=A0ABR8PSV0_9CLOT|nr:hypothetical protein [Clostridium cibarium]MBD7911255.1 hypothetical protein [Clostridium cibarium]
MKVKNVKLTIAALVVFQIILVISAIINIMSRDWKGLGSVALAIVCTTLPFIVYAIANKKKIMLPPRFKLVLLLFIFLSLYLGEIIKFYDRFWWWDLLLHGIFGSYATIVGLYIIKEIITKEKEVTDKRFNFFKVTFASSFSITLGTLWEVFEFLGDYFFKTTMVKGGIEDTATDLIAKILAAFITSVIFYLKDLKKVRGIKNNSI